MKRKICVYIGGRANYSSIKSVMVAIQKNPKLELQLMIGAATVLDRYGNLTQLLQSDGFHINYKFFNIVEGETPLSMTKTTGLGLIETSTAFDNLKPDMVLVVGDRYDVMPVAIAAAYMNIPLAHTMGGEVTGTIDESIRHAITKFSHIHFPANEDARERIIKMGEIPNMVFNHGCPRNDLVREEIENNDSYQVLSQLFEKFAGVGQSFDLTKPYLLVSQHPVTTEYGDNRLHMEATLDALEELKMNTIILWPNSDAGADEISRAIRIFREKKNPPWLHAFKNLPTDIYIHIMNTTSCLIGNSSSGVREGSFIGTPVVNIGTRQNQRQAAHNVMQVAPEKSQILKAIQTQIKHGKYPTDPLYGDGTAGDKIAKTLAEVKVEIQKVIQY